MWQKVIMKINVNYLFHCKRLMPYKDKHYVQIVHVSLFLPCPRVLLIVLLIATIVQSPDIVQIWGLFQYVFHFGFDLFNKHVEKDFLQHGLGTPYSNSACFDKDDIWNFCSFLYSACQLHYFSPSPLNWTLQQISSWSSVAIYWSFNKRHSTPKVMFSFRFLRKNKWQGKYFIFNGGWRNSCDCKCILFQYCWRTCKNNLYWYSERSIPNQEAANMREMCVSLWFKSTGTVCEDELITSSNNKGYCHRKCFFLF